MVVNAHATFSPLMPLLTCGFAVTYDGSSQIRNSLCRTGQYAMTTAAISSAQVAATSLFACRSDRMCSSPWTSMFDSIVKVATKVVSRPFLQTFHHSNSRAFLHLGEKVARFSLHYPVSALNF